MSEWIKFERLPNNDLPLPKYGTKHSAAIDFAACLTRPCQLVGENKKRLPFLADDFGNRHYDLSIGGKSPFITIEPNEVVLVSLGYKSEFNNQYVLNIHVRSSTGIQGLAMANGTGIIDSDYRGDLLAPLLNRSKYAIKIEHGDRIVQGILFKFDQAIIQEGKVENTTRGEGGLGSTGVKAMQVS